jgi:putative flippase GtrA
MILTDNKERVRFLKFITVGASGSVIDLGIANLLFHFFNAPLVLAGSISFVCAVFNNFTWNRHWTYPDSRSRPLVHQLSMYFLVSLTGICIRIPTLHFMEPVIQRTLESFSRLPLATTELLAKNATLILAIGIVMIWNFFVNRYWTYNDVD